MASIAKLVVSLGANVSNFETDMKRAGRVSKRELGKMERQAKQLNDKWNRNFKMAGLAVAGGLAVATKAAIDFESSMAEISTLLDGSTTKSMAKLGETVKQMSVQFGQAPTDTAKALYDIISAGAQDSATQIEQLTAANKLAVGGITDVAVAADLLTTAVNSYAEQGLTAEQAIDGLFTTVKQGKTTIPELAASFGQVATVAASVGVSFNELNALTGTLTKGGIATAETMTSLKGVFNALLKQSPKSLAAAKDLGIEFKLLGKEGERVGDLFKRIAESSSFSKEKLAQLFPEVRGLTGAMKVLQEGGAEFTRQLEAQINKMGAADKAFNKMAESTKFMAAQAKAAVQVILVHFGDKLLRVVGKASSGMVNHINTVIAVIENLVALVTVRVGIAMAASFAAATAGMTGMAAVMAIVGGNVGILLAAIALLIVNFDRLATMNNIVGTSFRWLGAGIMLVIGVLQAAGAEILNFGLLLLNLGTAVITPVASAIATLVNALNQVAQGDFKGALQTIGDAGNKLADDFDIAAGRVKENWGQIGLSLDIVSERFDNAKSQFKEWGQDIAPVTQSMADMEKRLFPMADATKKFHEELAILRKNAAGWDPGKLAQAELNLANQFRSATQAIAAQSGVVANVAEGYGKLGDKLDALLARLFPARTAQAKFNAELELLNKTLGSDTKKTKEFGEAVAKLKADYLAATSGAKKLAKGMREYAATMQSVGRVNAENEKLWRDVTEEVENFEQAAAALENRLFPLESLTRQYNEDLEVLRQKAEEAAWSVERLAEAERRLEKDFKQASDAITNQSDILATALDESVRILTRTFQSMWEGILTGAEFTFNSIADSFQALLANLVHQATTNKILVNIQTGIQGTNSTTAGGGINWGQLGGDLVKFASIIAGSAIGGGGQFASLGAAGGGLLGSAAFSALLPTLFKSLGSFAGPIGTIIGGVLGGLLGGLFDKERPAVVQVTSFDTSNLSASDDDSIIKSLFGETFIRSRRLDAQAIGDISQAIEQFDSAFSFLDAGSIDAITSALEGWGQQMEGEAINLEQLLTSRFGVILGTFGDDIQAFVNRSADLAEQMDRLQVAVSSQGILDAAPELFSGRTLDDFLNVTEAFGDSLGSITDGFNEVVRLVNIVGATLTSLKDFVSSDLSADYNAALGDVSLTDALAGMNSGLMDAVANFDGSIESLQQIGAIAMTIREGELRLLAQIDGVMQGLNANLDKLKADILAVGQPDQTGEQIFKSAASLISTVAGARTPEEIAGIGQQFEGLIRSLSEADQLANQSELARMIEVFRASANDNLAAQRQEVLDNATETRDMLDGFLTRIGDTLDIIAGSNQASADYLGVIAGGNVQDTTSDVIQGFEVEGGAEAIGPGIENAIRQGFSGVNVNVVVQGQGLVNE